MSDSLQFSDLMLWVPRFIIYSAFIVGLVLIANALYANNIDVAQAAVTTKIQNMHNYVAPNNIVGEISEEMVSDFLKEEVLGLKITLETQDQEFNQVLYYEKEYYQTRIGLEKNKAYIIIHTQYPVEFSHQQGKSGKITYSLVMPR